VGALACRDDPKLYNSDKERALLSPASEHYTKLAEECTRQRVTFDLFFAMNNVKSIDLASIAPLAALTGGDLHFLCPYEPSRHAEKLHYDIFRVLTRATGTDVQIKARVSGGLSVGEYFGAFTYKEQ
jgi:Sec23/Sec24 trunk domain